MTFPAEPNNMSYVANFLLIGIPYLWFFTLRWLHCSKRTLFIIFMTGFFYYHLEIARQFEGPSYDIIDVIISFIKL